MGEVATLSFLSIQLFQLNFTTIFVIASVIFCRHYVARVAVRGSGGNLSCSYFFVNTYVIFGSLSLYTVNHKKRDILFLTITLANLNRFS